MAAIKKNVVFDKPTKYGNLEITINLSKPEKDPKAIAAAAHDTAKKYPQCALCMENEGYKGRLGQAARSNHRIIRITVGGQQWGFQYSPYAYFHEHCIFLDSKHEPMEINRQTLINLVEIENNSQTILLEVMLIYQLLVVQCLLMNITKVGSIFSQ